MPEPTDAEREQQIRAEMTGRDPNGRSRFLLRLLDAERARADAAERAGAVRALRKMAAIAYDNGSPEWMRALDRRASAIQNGADV